MKCPHDPEGGAPLHTRKTAGIAVGVNPDPTVRGDCRRTQLVHQIRTELTKAGLGHNVVFQKLGRRSHDRVAPLVDHEFHGSDRPHQVHCRRPGHPNPVGFGSHPFSTVAISFSGQRRNRYSQGTGHADGRSTAHGQTFDRVDHGVDVANFEEHQLVRQQGLINQHRMVTTPINCSRKPRRSHVAILPRSTKSRTRPTAPGPQHPAYGTRLTGRPASANMAP